MKCSFLLPLAACGVVLMASCADERESFMRGSDCVTFTVADWQSVADTRVDVSIDQNGASFLWTEGDTLGVFPTNGFQTAFPISAGSGTNAAQFDGADWALRKSAQYAAYYPMQHPLDAVDKSAIAVSYVGQCQSGNGSTAHIGSRDYLATPFTTVGADGNADFQMAHMGALVRFQLTVPVADVFSSLTIKSDGAQFVTAGTIDLTAATPALAATATSNTVSLALDDVSSDAADETLTLYMMMAPADLSSAQLTFTLAGGEETYKASAQGKNFASGMIYGYALTLAAPLKVDGHEYVDLGLPSSLLWATCNVGASSPEEYGNYYAWGETKAYGEEDTSNAMNYSYNSSSSYVKTYYEWSTYKYCNGSYSTQTKYCTNSSYGTVDNITTLDLADDAARANWGGSWRMPTHDEFTELCNNCTATWTTVGGVYGRLFTSNNNGNTLFLPAAGCRYETSLGNAGSDGGYWSSSLDSDLPSYAWNLGFDSGYVGTNDGGRCSGRSVRAVWSEAVAVTSIQVTGDATQVNVGETLQLSVSVLPANATDKNVTWTSGDESIAIVSATGLVTAVAAGTVTITATANDESGVSGTYQITVPFVHEYVDLGLPSRLLWATCNVGASSPEEYGDYFAWGETTGYNSGKTTFNWSTYKYCNGSESTQTKYCTNSSYGTVDNIATLDVADDAARANWGGSWRMPTHDEFTELRNNCTATWTTVNGVYGCLFTSNNNGNTLFLPAAGFRDDASLYLAGSDGYYWSSSLYSDYPYLAWYLDFYSNFVNPNYYYSRYYGQSVRAVRVAE
ncbi:MAG: Ig-like domain-containing protein [Bacteroidales bacterium]|nr:Ig-like domain-containing protein [Bacteroidales bacterium]